MCGVLGYDVRRDDADGFDGATAVVIATHGGAEADIISAALDAGVGYVGLVASRVRGASVLDTLDLDDDERARVHTPVGLPIGAKTPAEIAVSIAAEVIAGIRTGALAVTRPVGGPPARETATDPVCGMTVAVRADTPHLRLEGQDYWFCCLGCRNGFAVARNDG